MPRTDDDDTTPECIAKHGGRICRKPVSGKGGGLLCETHLILLQNGRNLPLRAEAERDPETRAAIRALKHGAGGGDHSLIPPFMVLTVLFTITLVLIEIIRMTVLEVPSMISIAGFDTATAAIRNAGPVVIVVLIVVGLMMLAGIAALTFFGLLFAVFALRSPGFRATQIGGLLAASGALYVLLFLTWWWDRIGNERQPTESWLRRKLGAILPGLRRKRRETQKPLRESFRNALPGVYSWLAYFWHAFTWLFATIFSTSHRGPGAMWTRITAVTITISGTLYLSVLLTSQFNQRLMAAPAKLCELPTEDVSPSSIGPIIYRFIKTADCWFYRPSPQTGTLTIASRHPVEAGHLTHSAGFEPDYPGSGYRSERVHYIGDFGDWAFVARAENPAERLLIRRSAIVEFARDGNGKRPRSAWRETFAPALRSAWARLDAAAHLAFARRYGEQEGTALAELHKRIDALSVGQDANSVLIAQIAAQPRKPAPFINAQFDVQVTPGTGGAGLPAGDFRSTFEDGFPVRMSGIVNDVSRRFDQTYLQRCTRAGHKLGHVDFAESVWNRADGNGVERVVEQIAKEFPSKAHADPAGPRRLIVLRGGASYTGSPAANIRLSERRAEWVLDQILQRLTGDGLHPTERVRQFGTLHRVQFAAFGVGERLAEPEPDQASSRAVEVILCHERPDDANGAPSDEVAALEARASTKGP